MRIITIRECADAVLLEFERNDYTKRSKGEMKTIFRIIERWFLNQGSSFYDSHLANQYETEIIEKYGKKELSKSRRNSLLNGMTYIAEYAEHGTISLRRRRQQMFLSEYYQGILDCINRNADWTKAKSQNVRYAAHTYFRWLQANNIHTLAEINDDLIRKYIIRCANCMTPGSLDTIRRNLKHLHAFLFEQELISSSHADVLSFVTPSMHRIQKPVPCDDIAAVLASIDRSTATGKRDFAMILLATVTGLRSIDIRKMAFSDIDWINGEIRLEQSKTGNMLALPLTTDVGEAIKDYILNGRPNSSLPNIFLSAKSPHTALQGHGLYNAFNHYRKKIGLPPCPVHGLRRALGTNMVIAGIPVTTVAQVLGHSHISATKQYISLDSVHLKQCALDFSRLPERGDVR